jgi:hypothetical protein
MQHNGLDCSRPRPLSRDLGAFLKSWRAAAPAMTIMEPKAINRRSMAMRLLLQAFDIRRAWGPGTLK